MLEQHYLARRPGAGTPRLLAADLNDAASAHAALGLALSGGGGAAARRVVLIAEAVLFYLDSAAVAPLLCLCARLTAEAQPAARPVLCFADRLPLDLDAAAVRTSQAGIGGAGVAPACASGGRASEGGEAGRGWERAAAVDWLQAAGGWKLQLWQPKPGIAKHMGLAWGVAGPAVMPLPLDGAGVS